MLSKAIVAFISIFISSTALSVTAVDLSRLEHFIALPNQVNLLEDWHQNTDVFEVLNLAKSAQPPSKMAAFSSQHLWQLYPLDTSKMSEEETQFYLVKTNEYINSYDVYLFDSNNTLITQDHLGLASEAVYQKPASDRQHVQLTLKNNNYYYLLIHQSSDQIQGNQSRLYTSSAFRQHQIQSTSINAFLAATILVLLGVNLALFSGYPDRAFGWFITFHVVLAYYLSSLYGWGQFVLPDIVVKHTAANLISLNLIMVFCVYQFSKYFLHLYANKRNIIPEPINKTIQTTLIGSALVAPFYNDILGFAILSIIMYPVFSYIIYRSIMIARAGFKPALLLAFPLGIQLTGATIAILYYSNILPSNFISKYALPVSSILEVLTIAYAIAVRARHLEVERHRLDLTDSLTGVANSAFLDHSLQKNWKGFLQIEKKVVILGIKLRGIVEVAQSLGPAEADRFVKEFIAHFNLSVNRASYVLTFPNSTQKICTQSNDRYLLMLRYKKDQDSLTKSVNQLIKNGLKACLAPPSLTFYTGEYLATDHTEELYESLRKLMVAETIAKSSERGVSRYTQQMDDRFNLASIVKRDLYSAIYSGQIQCWIQPQFVLIPFNIRGGEILIRWDHPEKGMIPPSEFIPLLEELNLISDVTKLVLTEASKWLSEHQHIGNLKLSVNISARDLVVPGFVNDVQKLTMKYPIGPNRICLEVTETAIMTDPKYCISVLKALKSLGFSIAVDDFGTGYSSLSYLSQIQPDEIKLDQSFVKAILTSDVQKNIVKTIIKLGENLDAESVAEGVEDQDTLDIINKLGCDVGQGYFWAKPMPLTDFEDWVSDTRKNEERLLQDQ